MSTPGYWNIRALILERSALEKHYVEAMQTLMGKLDVLFSEAGLDKSKNYTMNDDEETITETEASHGRAD